MKKTIEAKIVADSISEQGHRITTMLLTYPRFIHSELMTHRTFSRNSASSRAIPFKKMAEMVKEDPFIPIAWQKDHKGMQGTEYITDEKIIEIKKQLWLTSMNVAIGCAMDINRGENGVTKQLCNRLLEPFMWHTCLVTSTEFENFFALRCPQYSVGNPMMLPKRSWKDLVKEMLEQGFDSEPSITTYSVLDKLKFNQAQAEIHMMALAEAMWDAMNESVPKQLGAGEWHIPFGDQISMGTLEDQVIFKDTSSPNYLKWMNPAPLEIQNEDDINLNLDYVDYVERLRCKIAVARCARLSYMTHEGKINYEKDIALHDHLLASKHFSPFEHIARCMSKDEFDTYVKGVITINPVGDGYSEDVVVAWSESSAGWCNNFRGWISYRYLIE